MYNCKPIREIPGGGCRNCRVGGPSWNCSCPKEVIADFDQQDSFTLFGQIEVLIPVGFFDSLERQQLAATRLTIAIEGKDTSLIYFNDTEGIHRFHVNFDENDANKYFEQKYIDGRKRYICDQIRNWFDDELRVKANRGETIGQLQRA